MAARHPSALKAHRQNVKRRARNRDLRTQLRHTLRGIRADLNGGEIDEAKKKLSDVFSVVDKMAGKGVIHPNTAGRYKSRLARGVAKKTASA